MKTIIREMKKSNKKQDMKKIIREKMKQQKKGNEENHKRN